MGMLVDGVWHDVWYDTRKSGGRFVRADSAFRDRVTADGSSGFPAEPGRYHLYVSLACPWAHRTLILRKLKGLEDAITVSVVHWHMGDEGWTFEDGPGCVPDTVNGFDRLHKVYTAARPWRRSRPAGRRGRSRRPSLRWRRIRGSACAGSRPIRC